MPSGCQTTTRRICPVCNRSGLQRRNHLGQFLWLLQPSFPKISDWFPANIGRMVTLCSPPKTVRWTENTRIESRTFCTLAKTLYSFYKLALSAALSLVCTLETSDFIQLPQIGIVGRIPLVCTLETSDFIHLLQIGVVGRIFSGLYS